MRAVLRAAAVLVLVATSLPAWALGFRDVVTSTTADAATSQDRFPADTAEIFVRAEMVDVAPGSIVTITWLAVDTGPRNPPNFRLDRAQLRVGPVGHRLTTSLPRPGAAWPAGSYQVRLAVNGKTVHRIDFTVE